MLEVKKASNGDQNLTLKRVSSALALWLCTCIKLYMIREVIDLSEAYSKLSA